MSAKVLSVYSSVSDMTDHCAKRYEAGRRFHDAPVRMIVSDWMMPDWMGWAFCRSACTGKDSYYLLHLPDR